MTGAGITCNRRCSASGQAGFSLLELLISLALLALLLAALPAALQLGRRAWQSSDAIDRSASHAVVQSFLQGRIARALPLLQREADGALRTAFRGEPERLVFVAPSLAGPSGPGLFVFEVKAGTGEKGGNAVMLRWWAYLPSADDSAASASEERVLLDDVAEFRLRYFGLQGLEAGRAWSERWLRTDALPELVELRLATRGGLAQQPMPAVIEIMSRQLP